MSVAPPDHPTAQALVEAATGLFGRHGYEGTSTRAIAAAAGTNVASIAYHFGGKAGLRLACAAAIAERVGTLFGDRTMVVPPDPHAAGAILEALVGRFLDFLFFQEHAEERVAFLLKELAEDGPVVGMLYDRVVGPRHAEVCRLWGAATGMDPEGEETRLMVFALIGQVLYFRIGAPLVRRRMGWARIGAGELAGIQGAVVANLRAAIQQAREAAT